MLLTLCRAPEIRARKGSGTSRSSPSWEETDEAADAPARHSVAASVTWAGHLLRRTDTIAAARASRERLSGEAGSEGGGRSRDAGGGRGGGRVPLAGEQVTSQTRGYWERGGKAEGGRG